MYMGHGSYLIATAVSSQDVSIDRISIYILYLNLYNSKQLKENKGKEKKQ